MNPKDQPIGNDPTIMGNEKPRTDRGDDHLPRREKVQEEDPRNGMNQPVDDASRQSRSTDKDEE